MELGNLRRSAREAIRRVLWFQCVSMYAELPNNSWSLKSNLTASYHMMAFWIEVIWVVDSFQLLHGIPFRWRPSIESGPRGGTGFLGTLGTLVLSSKPYWQYDAIRNHHFITLVCGGCFGNVSKLVETEKNRFSLSRVANRLWERQLWWWCLGWNASPWQLGAEWEPCPDFLELGKR